MDDFYCKVYINSTHSIEELAANISRLLRVDYNIFFSMVDSYFTLDVRRNKEYDEKKSKDFPDGYLYFPYFLDIEITDMDKTEDYKTIISKLLSFLWDRGCQVVASCDFEDELAHLGGYNRRINCK